MLLFLALELGLAWMLAYMRVRSLASPVSPWMGAYRFWVRVFALASFVAFAASIPVMVQLGSLWPGLLGKIGDVAGPLLAAGLATVYVFKTCFLGAMLFGERRLSSRAHAAVVVLVAVGSTLMVLWLVVLVSWMHIPTGAQFTEGRYQVENWLQVVFNPAFPWYAGLYLLGSLLCAAFLVIAVVAVQSLRRPSEPSERLAFRMALRVACACIVLQGLCAAGDGLVAARYLPAKAAAVSGYWHSGHAPDMVLFGWPDAGSARNRAAWSLPEAGKPWLARDDDGRPRGLDQFSGMAPPVAATFWFFRAAVLTGLALALVAGVTLVRIHRSAYDPGVLSRAWRHVLGAMSFMSWILILAGLAYILLAAYPYAVTGTITVAEIAGSADFSLLASVLVASLLLYGLFIAGFLRMVRHIARYGVVPVARHRGRA